MITPSFFVNKIKNCGLDFFCGVPDSLLKSFCACLSDTIPESNHWISANEGSAIGMATGHYLATGSAGVVYMQNSGEGNAINPLVSLADEKVYGIPIFLLIGWRGEPGIKDEPQHVKQGEITLNLLNTLGIEYNVLPSEESEASELIESTISSMYKHSAPYAIIVRKNTFDKYSYQTNILSTNQLTRENAIQTVIDNIEKSGKKSVVVSSTGMISRELYEYRVSKNQDGECDFLTVGSMGHASAIAMGIALAQPNIDVYCFDGDGAILMHMGGLAIWGTAKLKNFKHILFNNGAHDSVGGQPTVGFNVDFCKIANGCGYRNAYRVNSMEQINDFFQNSLTVQDNIFLEIIVKRGARADLGRPKSTPQENKIKFMKYIQKNSTE